MKFKFTFPKFRKIFDANRDGFIKFVAATYQAQRAMRFDAEGADNGHPKWAPLKFRTGMILSKRGDLRRSVAPRNDGITPARDEGTRLEFSGSSVTVGSDLKYAGIQNYGGTIKAKGKALKIPIPMGKKGDFIDRGSKRGAKVSRWAEKMGIKFEGREAFIFRKSVTIPARPYMDVNDKDREELETSLANRVAEVLGADERSVKRSLQGVIRVSS